MKKFVRCKTTAAFLSRDGSWTTDVDAAMDIPNIIAAFDVVDRHKLSNVELYYSYDNTATGGWNFAVNL